MPYVRNVVRAVRSSRGCLHASETAQNDRVGLTNGAEAIVQGLTARERSHSLAAGVTD
jgi:hypothetical protein